MDRISDEWLAAEIRYLEGCNSENYSTYISALVELRERRKAEHGVVKFKWVCRCGHSNIWSWPMVEYVKWLSTSMECDKCKQETMMHERPEVIHGYRCVIDGCGWTKDDPVLIDCEYCKRRHDQRIACREYLISGHGA